MPKSTQRALPSHWHSDWSNQNDNTGYAGGLQGEYRNYPRGSGDSGGYGSRSRLLETPRLSGNVRFRSGYHPYDQWNQPVGSGARGPFPNRIRSLRPSAPMFLGPSASRGAGMLSSWMYTHNDEVTGPGGEQRGYNSRFGPGIDRINFFGGNVRAPPPLRDLFGNQPYLSYPSGETYDDEGDYDPFALDFEEWFEGDNEKYCPLCDAYTTGDQPWQAHIEGARHRRKKSQYFGIEIPEPPKELKKQKKPLTAEELDDVDKPKITKTGNGGVGYTCEMCKVTCQDMNIYATHVQGTKHQKKKRANALWALGAELNSCAICRIDLDKPCLKCENNKTVDQCNVIDGECNHMVHDCCMSIWAHNTKCPVCGEAWKVVKKVQYCCRPAETTA